MLIMNSVLRLIDLLISFFSSLRKLSNKNVLAFGIFVSAIGSFILIYLVTFDNLIVPSLKWLASGNNYEVVYEYHGTDPENFNLSVLLTGSKAYNISGKQKSLSDACKSDQDSPDTDSLDANYSTNTLSTGYSIFSIRYQRSSEAREILFNFPDSGILAVITSQGEFPTVRCKELGKFILDYSDNKTDDVNSVRTIWVFLDQYDASLVESKYAVDTSGNMFPFLSKQEAQTNILLNFSYFLLAIIASTLLGVLVLIRSNSISVQTNSLAVQANSATIRNLAKKLDPDNVGSAYGLNKDTKNSNGTDKSDVIVESIATLSNAIDNYHKEVIASQAMHNDRRVHKDGYLGNQRLLNKAKYYISSIRPDK